MATYFGGNVLQAEIERSSDDHTFRFDRQQADSLQLVGCPVRLEHEESLTVGRITKQMKDRRGKIYVVGRIENDLKSSNRAVRMFADKALGGLYTSLSLQHEHVEDLNGDNKVKKAIEVSLVHEPRRPNCNIDAVRRQKVGHAASARQKAPPSENATYINGVQDIDAKSSSPIAIYPDVIATMDTPIETAVGTPTTTTPDAVAADKTPSSVDAPQASTKEGDIVMQDVIKVVVEQVRLHFSRKNSISTYCISVVPSTALRPLTTINIAYG